MSQFVAQQHEAERRTEEDEDDDGTFMDGYSRSDAAALEVQGDAFFLPVDFFPKGCFNCFCSPPSSSPTVDSSRARLRRWSRATPGPRKRRYLMTPGAFGCNS